MEVIITVTLLVITGIVYSGFKKEQAKERARLAYAGALARLKQRPTDANLKQETLALGRVYSNLTRNKTGQTLFDEVALMNDINAACAAATGIQAAESLLRAPSSIEDRLHTLGALRSKGLIEGSEYEQRRREILSSI